MAEGTLIRPIPRNKIMDVKIFPAVEMGVTSHNQPKLKLRQTTTGLAERNQIPPVEGLFQNNKYQLK